MKRIWRTSLIATIFLALPASALAAIEITRINFDPAGRDTGTNAHLNEEMIVIENTGSRGRSLDGWKLHDKGRDHLYRLGEVRLNPGDTLTLHTGTGEDGAAVCGGAHPCPVYYDSYWDLRNYVWNNGGDVATLRNRAGKVVDRCRYGSAASSPKRC